MDPAEECLEAHHRPEHCAVIATAGLVLSEEAVKESDIEQIGRAHV